MNGRKAENRVLIRNVAGSWANHIGLHDRTKRVMQDGEKSVSGGQRDPVYPINVPPNQKVRACKKHRKNLALRFS